MIDSAKSHKQEPQERPAGSADHRLRGARECLGQHHAELRPEPGGVYSTPSRTAEDSAATSLSTLLRRDVWADSCAPRQYSERDLIEDPEDGYTNHTVALEPGDKYIIFSDGYADQFGGPDGKKFRYKRFREVLLENYPLSKEEEKIVLEKAFIQWRGDTEQIDDVLVMGMRIPEIK